MAPSRSTHSATWNNVEHVEQPVTSREIDVEQTWNGRGTRGTPREWTGTAEQVFVGVDPGLHAGGLALVLGDGSAVQLTWWRSLSRGFEFTTWNGSSLDVERHDTLSRGAYLLLPRVKATSAAVEAVRRHRGRSAPVCSARHGRVPRRGGSRATS